MPFKFWKRDKSEKEKGEAAEAKKKESAVPVAAETKEAAKSAEPAARSASPAVAEAPIVAAEKAPVPAPPAAEVDAIVSEVHAGLVDLGLTIPGTKAVFSKRVASLPGGTGQFAALYHQRPHRAGTQVLAAWLGFIAPADFDPAKLLADVNLRLSSFRLSIQMSDLTWLDQELSLRKAHLRFGDVEKVVRFKDARDFIKGVNELIAPKRLVFLELETWTDDHAFLLVREPKWDKLAASSLVVVKAPQTAVGGECGECGAAVGPNWHDCLSCGAVFGPE